MKFFNPRVNGREIRRKYDYRPIVIFPRNLSYVRGPMLMIETIKEVRKEFSDVLLLILGEGPMRGRLEEYVKKRRLGKNVVFAGHRDHFKEMPKYYAASDLVVIPSLCREGCSLACLEAMATRKPVVATNVGGLLDIVIDKYNGLLCDVKKNDLAEKICYILKNRGEAKRISKNGYKWVKERHTYERWCKRYSNFFDLS